MLNLVTIDLVLKLGRFWHSPMFFFKKRTAIPQVIFSEAVDRRCFPVNFAKYLQTHFLSSTSGGGFYIIRNDQKDWQVLSEFLPLFTEAVAQRTSIKKVFLDVSQNSQKSTCVRVSIKEFLLKKDSNTVVFLPAAVYLFSLSLLSYCLNLIQKDFLDPCCEVVERAVEITPSPCLKLVKVMLES